MPYFKRLLVVFLVCVLSIPIGTHIHAQTAGRTVTVAVVRDGPMPDNEYAKLIETELGKHLPGDTNVLFKEDPGFNAQWKPERYRTVIENALNDPEVDLIVLIGDLTTQQAAKSDLLLTKPVVSSYVQRADLFKIPYSLEEGSLKENLSFILIPGRNERAVQTFQRMIPVKRINFILNQQDVENLENISSLVQELENKLKVDIIIIPLLKNIEEALSQLDDTAEVTLVGRLPQLSAAERKNLFRELTLRKIPTLSLIGHADVHLGALAAITPDITPAVIKRIALSLGQLIRGEPVKSLPVLLNVDTKLLINGRTAAELGYVPHWETKVLATFLYEEALKKETTPLNFEEVLKMAEKGNTSLAIREARVESNRRSMQTVRSVMLPQVFGSAGYQHDNPWGRLKELLPTDHTVAGITLSQMLYDDEAISDFRSSKSLYEGSQFDQEAERLDVLAGAGSVYLRFVLTRLLYEIQLENMRLTEDNLELSRIRVDVGYAGRDEVYRWEAELAKRRSQVLGSEAQVESQRITLNQILGVEQGRRWEPEEIEVDPQVFTFLDGELTALFADATLFEQFRQYSLGLAFQNAPELMSFDKALEAQDIQLGQRKRKFFLPSFYANLSYDYQIHRSPAFTGTGKGWFTFGISAILPLFNGGGKYYDMKKVASDREALNREKDLSQELVERRTRTAVRQLEHSFPSIRFNVTAAENAAMNLQVVQDKYAQGIENITRLLEAQNESFQAEQGVAIATYSYLADLVGFQRAISWFEDERSPEEIDKLLENFQAFLASQEGK
ncbi:MAG: hypothetical protein GQ544_00555 [Candidatus Aminicenantes bacterium]|nr:hypothetical protein [Candidatus Aminicenantes bacterium]